MKKRILQILVLAASSACCLDASAIAKGFYMGLMMGPASNTGSEKQVQVMPLPTPGSPTANVGMANPKSTQFGSRLFLGYKFNQYAGFEGGFTYFSGISYILTDPSLQAAAGTTGRVRSIDFVGKLDYSYNNTLGIFTKIGAAAVYTTTPGGLNVENYNPGPPVKNSGSNTYTTKVSPTFAFGVSYDLNQNWQLDASWTRIFAGGSISNMNLYAVGLSYHFVDVYCGQFLCE